MTNYRHVTRQAAKRYGLDPDIFERQIGQESGFNPHAVSPAGARGIAQIMPATARGWGVDPDDPVAALNAAAKAMAGYVKKYGSYRDALVAYNAGPGRVGGSLPTETQNYIRTILGGKNPKVGKVGQQPSPRSAPGTGGNATGGFDAGTSPQGLAALIASATAPQRTAPPVTLRPAPAFAAKAPLPAGYAGIEASSAPPAPKPSIDDQITQAAQLTQLALPKVAKQPGAAGGSSTAGGTVAGGRRGQVKVAPGANRQGQGLSGELTHFVSLVAGRARQPITITTGTNHDRLTVNGNVSDHYDGHASDIAVPVDSGEGDHIASSALQAAGVPKARAVKLARQGGLFNVNYKGHRVQVIWKTYEGGNHHNHVHIGIR